MHRKSPTGEMRSRSSYSGIECCHLTGRAMPMFAQRKIDRADDLTQPGEFKLLAEERRNYQKRRPEDRTSARWSSWSRLATLTEAKAVVTQYQKYLTENWRIKSVSTPKCYLRQLRTTVRQVHGQNGGTGPSGSRMSHGRRRSPPHGKIPSMTRVATGRHSAGDDPDVD